MRLLALGFSGFIATIGALVYATIKADKSNRLWRYDPLPEPNLRYRMGDRQFIVRPDGTWWELVDKNSRRPFYTQTTPKRGAHPE